MRFLPIHGDDDVAVPCGLAKPFARFRFVARTRPEVDHLVRTHAGISQRDLMPANVKVRADGTVKVLDFGLAKTMDPTGGSGATGIELHQKLVNAGHAIPTILITAYPDETVRARAVRAGILCYLPKPVTSDALLACIDEALEER